ncbi:hypothetical protein Hanom_Chr07g00641711 [Helianthus anomalus]
MRHVHVRYVRSLKPKRKIHEHKQKKSELPFWSLRFGQFCHFSPNLNPFASGSLWFHFYCHFGQKGKSTHISQKKKPCYFVLFLRG